MNNLNKFGLPSALGSGAVNFSKSNGGYETPTDFVDLPSQGKFYSKDSPLYGVDKVEVKFMTAREEDLLVSPSLNKAGIALDRVIESLLVDKRIKAKDLLLGDKNAILINARKNAFGENYEFPYICLKCGAENTHVKNLNDISNKEIKDDENATITDSGTILLRLPKSGINVELKFLKGEDETSINQVLEKRTKNNLPQETLITRYRYMILSVNGDTDTETIISFINSMPIMDSSYLKKKYAELNPDINFTFSADCSNCGHTTEGGVPIMVNFFWPEL
jgi:hypothetical protein